MPEQPTPTPEILAKYTIDQNGKLLLQKIKNASLDTYTNEPKDEINVEIGDTKQVNFYPQVKLCRWTNETNFSLRLIESEPSLATVSFDAEKIIWNKGNYRIEYYDYPEGEGG